MDEMIYCLNSCPVAACLHHPGNIGNPDLPHKQAHLYRTDYCPICRQEIEKVEVVRCKDCHFFERNHFDSLDGVPIITAHNICTRWGNGCMTYENGYCFMGIRGERRDATE